MTSNGPEHSLDPEELARLGLFARQVAHDLNNYLSTILGYASLMSSKMAEDNPHRRYAKMIEQAGNEAGGSVSRLLVFGRIWTSPASRVPLELSTVQQEIAHVLEGESGGQQAEVASELIDTSGRIAIDPHQMQIAFQALAANAREAQSEADPPRIHVRFSLTEHDALPVGSPASSATGKWLEVRIRDEGKGMDSETLSQAMRPGFTTHAGARRQGLGLPTTLGFVHRHGGAIALDSAEGQGTTVTLWLPVDKLA
jgi:signal transduction histidine kinase